MLKKKHLWQRRGTFFDVHFSIFEKFGLIFKTFSRYETERYQIGENADVEKTKSKHKVQIEEARQETARVEAVESNKCIIS